MYYHNQEVKIIECREIVGSYAVGLSVWSVEGKNEKRNIGKK